MTHSPPPTRGQTKGDQGGDKHPKGRRRQWEGILRSHPPPTEYVAGDGRDKWTRSGRSKWGKRKKGRGEQR